MEEHTQLIRLAVGTDDNIFFSQAHFGSAKKYLIYSFNLATAEILLESEIENTTPEEEKHGDPKKAKNISSLLPDVSVLVARYMGANINKMRKKYVPIISKQNNIIQCMKKLPTILDQIIKELHKPVGTVKKVLRI